jgi:hypothetical protein
VTSEEAERVPMAQAPVMLSSFIRTQKLIPIAYARAKD